MRCLFILLHNCIGIIRRAQKGNWGNTLVLFTWEMTMVGVQQSVCHILSLHRLLLTCNSRVVSDSSCLTLVLCGEMILLSTLPLYCIISLCHGLGGLNSLFGDKTSGGSSASSTNMILCTVRHAVHYARVYDTVLVNKVGLTNISNINLFTASNSMTR